MFEKWENPGCIGEHRIAGHADYTNTMEISLNGTWGFRSIKGADSADEEFYRSRIMPVGFVPMEIPTCIECEGFGEPYYFGAGFPGAISKNKKKIPCIDHGKTFLGLFYRQFDVPQEYIGKRLFLNFKSVKSAFTCWINGKEVGLGKGSMLPVEFEVTEYIKPGQNTVAVKVYSFSDATYLEDQDMWFLSGIYRDVCLYAKPESYLFDYYGQAEFGEGYQSARLNLEVTVDCPGEKQEIGAKLLWQGDVVATERTAVESGSRVQVMHDDRQKMKAAVCHLQLDEKEVKLWSAETPNLYQLEITLFENDEPIDCIRTNYGFKEIRIDKEHAVLKINGQPLKLRGVNYHAFTPDHGYYVSPEVYRKDLQTMKQFNINAIRTSHYPQDEYFYELCDEYGIYVMDEVNVETHAVRDKNVPHDPMWRSHVVDRMRRMVLRDRNHACVAIYSLGNESNAGENHYHMKAAALDLDTTRPIHYEGGKDLQLSDFLCDGYSAPEREQMFADGKDVKKKGSVLQVLQVLIPFVMSLDEIKFEDYKNHPIVATEYNYCMGNSSCDVLEHTEIFDRSDRWCGGFAWDYKDKSMKKPGFVSDSGQDFMTYGGDFGVRDQKGNICCDGMTDWNGEPHSVMYELKKAFAPVTLYFDREKEELTVRNRNAFVDLSAYTFEWRISRDGHVETSGILELHTAPRSEEIIEDTEMQSAIAEAKKDEASRIVTFEIKVRSKQDTAYYACGHEITEGQWLLREDPWKKEGQQPEALCKNSAAASEDGEAIVLASGAYTYVISKKDGNLKEITKNQQAYLKTPLRPAFYRAVTDADAGFIGIAMGKHKNTGDFGKLTEVGLGKPKVCEVKDGVVNIVQEHKLLTLQRQYALAVDGSLCVWASLATKKKAPVRFGMQMEVDKAFDQMTYLGQGPEDTYWGRDESNPIGIYTQSVDKQDEYVRPQEHGNKRHVVWADFEGGEKRVHVEHISGEFAISVWPYTLAQLHKAEHIHELPEHDMTTINLDCIQQGLGDCFVRCPERYKLKSNSGYAYSFRLLPQ